MSTTQGEGRLWRYRRSHHPGYQGRQVTPRFVLPPPSIYIAQPYVSDFLGVLRSLLARLHRKGIATEDLSLPDNFDDEELVYHGLCRKGPEGMRRRIGEPRCFHAVPIPQSSYNPPFSPISLFDHVYLIPFNFLPL